MKYIHIKTGLIGIRKGDSLVLGPSDSVPMLIIENSLEWKEVEEGYEILYSGDTDTIEAVKITLTGESFKVGQKVVKPDGKVFTIGSFYYDSEGRHILCGPDHIGVRKVAHIKPLGKTYDLKSFYPGDTLLAVRLNKNFNVEKVLVGNTNFTKSKTSCYFLCMEDAEKWLLHFWNSLSVAEVMDVIKTSNLKGNIEEVKKKLGDITRGRINKIK